MMKFDLIIVGGGMVGAALACALRESNLKIALIDAAPASFNDPRLIALNHSSCNLFQNLNLWSQLQPYAAAIHEVHASYRGHFGTTRITAAEMNLKTLGHVVPAKFINSVLYDALKNIEVFRPATLKNLHQQKDVVTLDVEMNSEIKTLEGKLIIGADGTHSTVRKLLNIPTETVDYQQSAIVTHTQLQRSHRHIAYERFHETGAIAMLPLQENEVATIWSDSNENVSALMQLSDEAFLEKLQKQFGYRLGRLQKISKRFVFPLQMIKAQKQIQDRVILIGNAAHTLHPVAAQGLNLALHEVAALAECFAKSLPDDFSQQNMLNDLTQQHASIRLSHYLPRIFTSEFFLVAAARQLGMIGLDVCSFAKKRFAKQAMGQAGVVPNLVLSDE
jgi:2-octaprenyl-6-methoxyphenol hydroxylase